jgi:hypothetical protein
MKRIILFTALALMLPATYCQAYDFWNRCVKIEDTNSYELVDNNTLKVSNDDHSVNLLLMCYDESRRQPLMQSDESTIEFTNESSRLCVGNTVLINDTECRVMRVIKADN